MQKNQTRRTVLLGLAGITAATTSMSAQTAWGADEHGETMAGGPSPAAGQMLGQEGSPVAEMFFSWSCGHCADYMTRAFPRIRQELIDTGRIGWIFTDLAFDRPSMTAAMIARSMTMAERLGFTDAMMRRQTEWTRSTDPIGTIISIAAAVPFAVQDETQLRDPTKCRTGPLRTSLEILMEQMNRAMRLGPMTTPTILFNGRFSPPFSSTEGALAFLSVPGGLRS